jgi:hypothetical protein
VDSIEEALARRETGESRRRRVAVGVDPERGALVQQQVIQDEGLEHGDAAALRDIQEGDPVVERRE